MDMEEVTTTADAHEGSHACASAGCTETTCLGEAGARGAGAGAGATVSAMEEGGGEEETVMTNKKKVEKKKR